jgi:hypothetical protein
LSFDLTVLAWDEASFPAALDCEANDAQFSTCPGDHPGTVLEDQGTPTFTTHCTATQQAGISVLAVCEPLEATGVGDAGIGDASDAAGAPIVVDTHGFVVDDSGTLLGVGVPAGAGHVHVRLAVGHGVVRVPRPADDRPHGPGRGVRHHGGALPVRLTRRADLLSSHRVRDDDHHRHMRARDDGVAAAPGGDRSPTLEWMGE